MVSPLTHILERVVNSQKFAPHFPLNPHIPPDISGAQQVDQLQTLYERTKPHPAKVRIHHSSTHYSYDLERELT